MELPVYSILVVVTLLSPNVNGGLIGNSSTNQPEVTYGQHVGNDSNTEETCTRVCGVKDGVQCRYVIIDEENSEVGCSCEDPRKSFVATTKECREKACIEECGVEDGVKCSVVTINDVPSLVTCSCEDPTKSFVATAKECKVLEKTVCEGEIAFKMCRWQSAVCVVDETAEEGFRCVCGVGYFEKNGVCTEKTACDDASALEVCRRKSAACVVDATAVEGFRCECDVGYFEKNGVCSKDDKNQKVIVISPSPDVIVLVLLTIVILLLLGVGFCNIRMNQKFKATHNSVPGVK